MTINLNRATVVAGIALVTLALAGCGGTSSSSSTPEAAKAEAGTTAAPPVRASVPPGAQFAVGAETPASLAALTESAACSLENVVNVADNSLNPGDVPNSYKAERGKAYKMIGFATNKDAGTVPKSIRLVLAGAQVYGINAATGSERPDVGAFFNNPVFSTAGYQADAAFDDVAPGEYRVLVLEMDAATPVACPTHQTITIK